MGDEDIGAAAMLVSRDDEEVSGNVVEGYSGMLNMNFPSPAPRGYHDLHCLYKPNTVLRFQRFSYKSPSIVIIYAKGGASVINPSVVSSSCIRVQFNITKRYCGRAVFKGTRKIRNSQGKNGKP